MNRHDLYEGMNGIDDEILERSEKNKERRRRSFPRWMAVTAAVLAAAFIGGLILALPEDGTGDGRPASAITAYAIAEAEYPDMPRYPGDEATEKEYKAWNEAVLAQRREEGYADGLEGFFEKSIREFLSGAPGENAVYSPLNVYMALCMLAELTGGESRDQILTLLGSEGIDSLREQASDVWNANYRDDGLVTSILASSLWLREDVSFVKSTMDTLADTYYASSYQGEMGSEEFNAVFQSWLNEQTGGLLEDQVEGIELRPETVLALAATIYFRAQWAAEFNEALTAPDTFHAIGGDVTCDFMHSSGTGSYCRGDDFGAVGRSLAQGGGTMWLILPDEGATAEELISDPQLTDFILSGWDWEDKRVCRINLSLPKFDVSSQTDLIDGLMALGVTDVFDPGVSDFTPMTEDMDGLAVTDARHGARVTIDEEGVAAAAYTVMAVAESGEELPDEEIDFTLDRPFIFAITSRDGLPLFVGIVNAP